MKISNKELVMELLYSKARGKLTRRACKMIELLGNRAIVKLAHRYSSYEDQLDCLQGGLHDMYRNWHNFDIDKTDNAFAYMTEIFKRGANKTFNDLYKKKGDSENSVRMISLSGAGGGNPIHSI